MATTVTAPLTSLTITDETPTVTGAVTVSPATIDIAINDPAPNVAVVVDGGSPDDLAINEPASNAAVVVPAGTPDDFAMADPPSNVAVVVPAGTPDALAINDPAPVISFPYVDTPSTIDIAADEPAPTVKVVVPIGAPVNITADVLTPTVTGKANAFPPLTNIALGEPAPFIAFGVTLPVGTDTITMEVPEPKEVGQAAIITPATIDLAIDLLAPVVDAFTLASPDAINLTIDVLQPIVDQFLDPDVNELDLQTDTNYEFAIDIPVDELLLDTSTDVWGGTFDIPGQFQQLSLSTSASFVLAAAEGAGPEERAAALGFRPSTLLLVRAIDIQSINQGIDELEPGDSFLVSNVFVENPNDTFYLSGARRAYVGTLLEDLTYVFRPPEVNEVVWFVPRAGGVVLVDGEEVEAVTDNCLYRYHEDPEVWLEYRTLPQRAVEGQMLFALLDPDGIYDYYAKLIGGAHASWHYDMRRLQDAYNPAETPEEFLPALAAQYGFRDDATRPVDVRRKELAQTIPIARSKGRVLGIKLLSLNRDYRAELTEIWVKTDAADNFTDLDDAPVGAVHADAAGNVTISVAEMAEIQDIQPLAITGEKGIQFFDAPHGYYSHNPDIETGALAGWWPSSRFTLHLNELDGSPLDVVALGDGADLKQTIVDLLARDGAPVFATIRFFATDIPVAGTGDGDSLRVGDEMIVSGNPEVTETPDVIELAVETRPVVVATA